MESQRARRSLAGALGALEMSMQIVRLFLVVGAVCFGLSAACRDTLYRARSGDMGYTKFDMTATETKRTNRTSVLAVPGFQSRSAPEARWLMCAYTDLAKSRGFEYWAVVYPEPPGENVLVGFPKSGDEQCTETIGPEFGTKFALPTVSVERMISACAAFKKRDG